MAAAAFAAKPVSEPSATAEINITASAIQWQPSGSFDRMALVVSGPDDVSFTKEFAAGATPILRLQDLGAKVADGQYTWQLRVIPRISAEMREKLVEARSRDDQAEVARLRAEAGLDRETTLSGAFVISAGSFVSDKVTEPAPPGDKKVIANGLGTVKAEDVVTADDAIIQGSLCVGLDCVNNESFGFDTIRLKENNTRIKFDDTSTTAGCPNNDWQLTANDACGGSNKFSIEDITGAKVPFTLTAGAPTNSLFVASSGKVGFGNSSPGLNLHITATDTPAIRQEQTNGGGFTAQTWDIGANEANWFVRDLTGGSRLPFRIRPGAPTSSIDISASGQVGVGTASPATIGSYYMPLQLASSSQLGSFLRITNSDSTYEMSGTWMPNNALTAGWLVGVNNAGSLTLGYGSGAGEDSALTGAKDNGVGVTVATTSGNVGIKCTSPSAQLVIASGSGCSNPTSTINAGSASFTTTSSRTFKENIETVSAPTILEKIEKVPVVTYDFKNNGPKNRMGLIAEDFYTVFHRGDDKHIDGQDVEMALWLAVQQLTSQNKQLTDRIDTLEKQLSQQQQVSTQQ
jgi:hypothetical protein